MIIASPDHSEMMKVAAQWRRKFAWTPVRVSATHKVWLEHYEERFYQDEENNDELERRCRLDLHYKYVTAGGAW